MNDRLQITLEELLRSGTEANPALNTLIDDYTRYHAGVAVLGGLLLMLFALLCVFFWKQFKSTPMRHGTRFERKTNRRFFVMCVLSLSLLAVTVAANVSNALEPRAGFAGSVGALSAPAPGTRLGMIHESFNGWLHSGSATMPPVIQSAIDDRLAWQRPKALICSALLLIFTLLSAWVWRHLFRKSRSAEFRWRLSEVALLAAGHGAVAACLLLILMVIGNTQASLAPITLTLMFG